MLLIKEKSKYNDNTSYNTLKRYKERVLCSSRASFIEWNYDQLQSIRYFCKRLHRCNKPSIMYWNTNLVYIQCKVEYSTYSQLRLKFETFKPTGPYYEIHLSYIGYSLYGDFHRSYGPAFQNWHLSGPIHERKYYHHGFVHRLKEPAYISWNENGQPTLICYYTDNQCKRLGNFYDLIKYDLNNV